jgi:hypothetical protein
VSHKRKSNGTRARLVGQGDPKTRDRPASENGISLKSGTLSGWRRSLGENMHTPMTPWAEAFWTLLSMYPRNRSRGQMALDACQGYVLPRSGYPARSGLMAKHVSSLTSTCGPTSTSAGSNNTPVSENYGFQLATASSQMMISMVDQSRQARSFGKSKYEYDDLQHESNRSIAVCFQAEQERALL